jgi:hypothetical protein
VSILHISIIITKNGKSKQQYLEIIQRLPRLLQYKKHVAPHGWREGEGERAVLQTAHGGGCLLFVRTKGPMYKTTTSLRRQ